MYPIFREKALANLGGIVKKNRAMNFFCAPLQEFTPEAGRYDIIWVLWCIGHLTDHDFLEFCRHAQIGSKPAGFFVLKENIAKNAIPDFDSFLSKFGEGSELEGFERLRL